MFKRFILAVLMTVVTTPLFAVGALRVSAQKGGERVSTAGFSSTTKVQRSYPFATITVYNAGTSTLTTLYSDVGLTIPASNPGTADMAGNFQAYGSEQQVDVVISANATSGSFTTFQQTYVLLPVVGGTNITLAEADARFLKLDTSNDPLTNTLSGANLSFTGTGAFSGVLTANNELHALAAGAAIYAPNGQLQMLNNADTGQLAYFRQDAAVGATETVRIENNSTSGTSLGMLVTTQGHSLAGAIQGLGKAYGVYGVSTGNGNGVEGWAFGTDGKGVVGRSTGTSAIAYGGYFEAATAASIRAESSSAANTQPTILIREASGGQAANTLMLKVEDSGGASVASLDAEGDAVANSLTTATGITATTGNIAAAGGNISASGTGTFGTGATVTSGNLTVSSGDITVTSGEITATSSAIVPAVIVGADTRATSGTGVAGSTTSDGGLGVSGISAHANGGTGVYGSGNGGSVNDRGVRGQANAGISGYFDSLTNTNTQPTLVAREHASGQPANTKLLELRKEDAAVVGSWDVEGDLTANEVTLATLNVGGSATIGGIFTAIDEAIFNGPADFQATTFGGVATFTDSLNANDVSATSLTVSTTANITGDLQADNITAVGDFVTSTGTVSTMNLSVSGTTSNLGTVSSSNFTAGSGSATFKPSGVIARNWTTINSAAVGTQQVLYSTTIPANTLDTNGQALRITAVGTYGAAAGNKTIHITLGIWSGVCINASAVVSTKWQCQMDVVRTGASAYDFVPVAPGYPGSAAGSVTTYSTTFGNGLDALNVNRTLSVDVTDTSATGSNTTLKYVTVEYLP